MEILPGNSSMARANESFRFSKELWNESIRLDGFQKAGNYGRLKLQMLFN